MQMSELQKGHAALQHALAMETLLVDATEREKDVLLIQVAFFTAACRNPLSMDRHRIQSATLGFYYISLCTSARSKPAMRGHELNCAKISAQIRNVKEECDKKASSWKGEVARVRQIL